VPWAEGLVFGIGPWRPFNSTPLAKRAERSWNAVGLRRITLHECRHTFASLMIAAGVNAKALSSYMGHANISITMDRYGHLMPGNEREAAGMLDSYLLRDAPGSRQHGAARTPGGPAAGAPGSPEEAVSRLIAARRRALGLTQHELAARVQMSPSLLSRIEEGHEAPSVRVLDLLARGLEAKLVLGLDAVYETSQAMQLGGA
jgi:DNA-binding XRE family transcriptional regulator